MDPCDDTFLHGVWCRLIRLERDGIDSMLSEGLCCGGILPLLRSVALARVFDE